MTVPDITAMFLLLEFSIDLVGTQKLGEVFLAYFGKFLYLDTLAEYAENSSLILL